ncbi:topology modulation protein [Halalkalibacter okhensis]|uniref:Topology modulation protein n=1 Tax=Halalkalibacter okhensis TaxID=333138 RepID=A0A0B0IBI6_9BACI|nr:topology modulation protein [Halalkalibacter okhensis]KHF39913.1 topology modulation protein [Halalkalibacter okhensis]
MNRIMVMGVSAGVGKSTFARKLGRLIKTEVYHLDKLYWKPNWVEASLEEFSAKQQAIVKQDKWIIDGNYSNTYDIRMKYCDTIIYIELPLYVCLYRVYKRWLTNIGRTRIDMGVGCNEKLDAQFIKFIISTYYDRKKQMKYRMKEFQQHPTNQVITLKSKKEIQSFLESLHSEKTGLKSLKI